MAPRQDDAGTDASGPMLTVAAVARRLGVAPATLRTWDRRYGLGPSAHTAGAHRRYSSSDLTRLVIMRRLTLEGVAPSEAARVAVESGGRSVATVHQLPGISVANLPAVERIPAPGMLPGTDAGRGDGEGRRRGGGRVVALPEGSPAARGLARAAMSMDSHECTRIVRESIDVAGVVRTWDHLAVPVLTALGHRWQSTGTGVEIEHLLTEAVTAALHAVVAGLRHPRSTRTAVLACAEGEGHVLPVHALAAAMAERGLAARMLGARVPREALAAAVSRSGPAVVFVYASSSECDPGQLDELPRIRPAPRVLAGGRGWHGDVLPAGVTPVSCLSEALTRMDEDLGG